MHRILDRILLGFLIDFPSIWDANLELSWPLRRAQDATKTAPKMKCATFFTPAVIFWSTSPPLGVIWARIGKIWGSVSEVSGAHAFTCFELFDMFFSNEVDSKLLGVGGMGEAILDPPDHLGESWACSESRTSSSF